MIPPQLHHTHIFILQILNETERLSAAFYPNPQSEWRLGAFKRKSWPLILIEVGTSLPPVCEWLGPLAPRIYHFKGSLRAYGPYLDFLELMND